LHHTFFHYAPQRRCIFRIFVPNFIENQKNQFMKKKLYEKPTTKVVKLQQQTHLLSVSGNTTLNVQYEEEDW